MSWRARRWGCCAATLTALATVAGTAHASVAVTTTTDELSATNNGQCSLREAVTVLDGDATARGCSNAGANPTTVNVPASATPYKLTLHGPNEGGNATGDLDVTAAMTIQGAGAGSTVIDGDQTAAGINSDRVFDVFSAGPAITVAINGVTVQDGRPPAGAPTGVDGGGIRVNAAAGTADLTLNDDLVTQNAAGQGPAGAAGGGGGGIANGGIFTPTAGTLTLNRTRVDHNFSGDASDPVFHGGYGGGIFSHGALVLDDSTVSSNFGGSGGLTSGDGGSGGGITVVGNATIDASTIAGNGAGAGNGNGAGGFGGGIHFTGSQLMLTNSTISGNAAGDAHGAGAGGAGGGIFLNSSPQAMIANDTIANNAAGAPGPTGGGIYGSGATVSNTILASNGGGNCAGGAPVNGGHNVSFGDATCPATFVTGDPNLRALADNGGPTQTLAIAAPSAALDIVPPTGAGCPTTDQRGVRRPEGLACDAGAYELTKRFGVSVSKSGTGSGRVASSPAGIDCGATCDAQFDQYSTVTLTPMPDKGSAFAGWSGGGCSGTGPCKLTIGGDATLTASFKKQRRPNTRITRARISQAKNRARFKFKATGGSKAKAMRGFQCALVKKKHKKPKFKACTSPKTYKHLKPRKYTFEVRAFDAAGKDATPAKKKFRIK